MKIKKKFIPLLFIIIFYILLLLIDIRGGYRTPDEIGFINLFLERIEKGVKYDFKYFIWGHYIAQLTKIHLNLPVFINFLFLFLCFYYFYQIKLKISNIGLLLLFFPSVLYFSLTYLRDIIFFASSMYLLYFLSVKREIKNYLIFSAILIISFIFRPEYGFLYLVSLILVYISKYRLDFFILSGLLLLSSLMIIKPNLSNIYWKKVSVHVRYSNKIGLWSFDKYKLNEYKASFGILFCWIKYWFYPQSVDIEKIFSILMLYETLFIILMFIYFIFLNFINNFNYDLSYKFSAYMLWFSFYVAAFEPEMLTITRHRLIFLPFIFYLAFSRKKKKSATT
ncbi:MAG: hypothetical protein ACMUJM_00075 [bacterium]